MKLFKKLASFILAFAMVMAIAMPSVVMAADGKSTITVDGATAGSEYVAYKLFDAVKVQKNDDIQYPRKYQDYTVTINDDEIPDTVEVKRMI